MELGSLAEEKAGGVNVEKEDHNDDGDDDSLAMMTAAFARPPNQSTVHELTYRATPDVWDGVRNAGASRPCDDDAMSMASNATRASTASKFSTVSYNPTKHGKERALQRKITEQGIKMVKAQGKMSLSIHLKGKEETNDVKDEISRWGERLKQAFEQLVVGEVIEKGQPEDRRLQMELHRSEKMGPQIKEWLKKHDYFREERQRRVIFKLRQVQEEVVVVEGRSAQDEVGVITSFSISGEFSPKDVSAKLWAYVKMKREPGELEMELLEERAEAISEKFNSDDVATTLSAYVKMGSEPGERLMRLLEERAKAISGEFKSQEVSRVLWAYGRMAYVATYIEKRIWRKPGEVLMGMLEERVKETSREFDARMLHDTLLGFANMEANVRIIVMRGSEGKRGEGERIPGEGVMGRLEQQTELILRESRQLNSMDLSKLLWAYSRIFETFDRKPGEQMMGLLERRSETILKSGDRFEFEDISTTMSAYAIMERKPGELLMGLLE
jgi:hypothetical protein